MALKPEDFLDDARLIGCEPAAIRAVAEVEASGGGFCPDGFPKLLFEGHKFHLFTKGKFTASHPTISYPSWTRKFYGKTWQEERARFEQAMKLDRTSALLSTSFGLFQVMGFNYAECGFKTVQQFLNAMCKSENSQLAIFTQFIINRGLADELRDLRWADFARLYNGPGQVPYYADKMSKAYVKLKKLTAAGK